MKIAISGREPWGSSGREAVAFVEELSRCGAALCYCRSFADSMRSAAVQLPRGEVFGGSGDLPSDVDVFLTLGGDGTFLSSTEYVRGSGIPVAGINFGRLGFLTAATASEKVARSIAGGDFSVQDRAMLKVSSDGLPEDFWPYALNEISFQRSGQGLLSIEVSLDGKDLPVYWADGILVATPTGSTAYSLSLGGPVVAPSSEVMLITPVASHNLNQRPLVVPLSSRLEICASGRSGVSVGADNRLLHFDSRVRATVSRGEFPFRYMVLSDNSFITALRSKLLWGASGRNSE